MRKLVIIPLFALLCSFQDVVGPDLVVMKAAESQLPAWMSKVTVENQRAYGFTEDDDLDGTSAGKPFRMMVFNTDFYKNKLIDERNYLIIKNEWRVPVIIKKDYRSLLTMEGNPGNYYIAGMGAPQLAKEIQEKTEGWKEEDEFYLLQVPDLLADFLVRERDNSFPEAEFVPLASAIIAIPALENKGKKSYTLLEVEHMVKDAIKPSPERSVKKEDPAPKPKPGPR